MKTKTLVEYLSTDVTVFLLITQVPQPELTYLALGLESRISQIFESNQLWLLAIHQTYCTELFQNKKCSAKKSIVILYIIIINKSENEFVRLIIYLDLFIC